MTLLPLDKHIFSKVHRQRQKPLSVFCSADFDFLRDLFLQKFFDFLKPCFKQFDFLILRSLFALKCLNFGILS